jgi:hypothetical protein
MRVILSNAGLTPGDFNIACFFVKSAFEGCVRDGDKLLFPEMSVEEAVRKSYYDDLSVTATAIDYQSQRAKQICMDVLALRGESENPGEKIKLEVQKSVRERYDCFITHRNEDSKDSTLLYAGDFQCPLSGFGVKAVWDTDYGVLWFEVCDSPPWDGMLDGIPEETYEWCVLEHITICTTAKGANEALYKAIGSDAYCIGFDESE